MCSSMAGLVAAAIALSACGQVAGSQSPSAAATAVKGVAFSPQVGANSTAQFFQALPSLGGTTSWSGDWAQLEQTSSAPYQLSALASANHCSLIPIVTAHQNTSPASLIRPLDSPTQASYLADLAKFFEQTSPKYFGIGIEVNNLHDSDPAGYASFVSLFAQAAKYIHSVSPTTKVFTVFQLEKMKGLTGGLETTTGAVQWSLLADFPGADLFAFTSYPFLFYHDPTQLPSNYYSEILQRADKPIAISELGWPSADVAGSWTSTPQVQSQFITSFAGLVKPASPQFVLWLSAYDQKVAAPFNHIGLASSDGTHWPAWDTWSSAQF